MKILSVILLALFLSVEVCYSQVTINNIQRASTIIAPVDASTPNNPNSLLHAQKVDTTYKYWMTIGGWIDRGFTTIFSYNFSLIDNFYKVGYFVRGGIFYNSSVGEDGYLFNSIDISIGKRLQSEWFQVSVFGGPSYVFGKKHVSHGNTEKYRTIGLETDIQLLFKPANEVGIGIGLYGNLNFVKNYAGININLTIGNGK